MTTKKSMIGVFGDSYADINPVQYIDKSLDRMPWPLWLQKISGMPVESHALSATSTWFSYKKFLDNYKKYDSVVFCYSDLHRWQNINEPSGISLGLYHIRYAEQLKHVRKEHKDIANTLVEAYKLLHDWDLDKFIFQSIFESVNKLCDASGIKLINIFNFEEINDNPLNIDITTVSNTVLTNLVQVSGNEYMNFPNIPKDPDIYKFITENMDKRFCHLSPQNNRTLADIVYNCMQSSPTYINLGKDKRFSDDVETLRYLLDLE